jgi:capsular polysaccharide biosynthesis protein
MDEIQSPVFNADEEDVSLLDLLVTLAENVKLLILGPLLVGLSALGLGYVLPQTFDSVAVLQADQTTASLMTSAAVLDPVAASLGLAKNATVEETRRTLRTQVKTAVGRTDKLLTLTVSAGTPQQAQALATAILKQTYQQSSPKGSVRARLEVQLAQAQGRLNSAQTAAASLSKRLDSSAASSASGSELVRGYADLLTAAAAAQKQIGELETQLEGLSEALLVQAPTLPEKASKPKKALLAIGATLATGVLLLLFVFMRQALRNAAADADAAGKLARIRRALGLKKQAT